jgi:hypothetical protein
MARALGLHGFSRLPKDALARVIELVRPRQAAAAVRLDAAQLAFDRPGRVKVIEVRSQSAAPLRLRLEVLDDSGAFTVAKQAPSLLLRPRGRLRIPVTFRPRTDGVLMTRARRHRGEARLWDVDGQRVVGAVTLVGQGPGYVPLAGLTCLYDPLPDRAPHGGNSPPVVSLRVRPEIGWSGEPLHVAWSVSGADTIWEGVHRPGDEVLPTGTFTDWGGGTGPVSVTSRTYDITFGRTATFVVGARNVDGVTTERVTAWAKTAVGYHAASTPAGGVFAREVEAIRRDLEDVDRRLRGGCIRDNTDLDRFGDPYLRGDLTDDILNAMRDVLVYIGPEKLPTSHRASGLCESGVYGVTPRDRSFVAICRALEADSLTLLHELYHYAAARDNGSEAKAFAVSLGCF